MAVILDNRFQAGPWHLVSQDLEFEQAVIAGQVAKLAINSTKPVDADCSAVLELELLDELQVLTDRGSS